jgi:hypothetical protein
VLKDLVEEVWPKRKLEVVNQEQLDRRFRSKSNLIDAFTGNLAADLHRNPGIFGFSLTFLNRTAAPKPFGQERPLCYYQPDPLLPSVRSMPRYGRFWAAAIRASPDYEPRDGAI